MLVFYLKNMMLNLMGKISHNHYSHTEVVNI